MLKPDKRLQTLYEKFNKRWFGGQLPPAVVCWDERVDEDSAGLTHGTELDPGVHQFTIRLHPDLKPFSKYKELILLHECVHVKLYPWMKHGKRFHSEMKRLAIEGAFDELW